MKKQILPPARYALLTACLLTGFAQAQSINFTGDTDPTGNMGASYSGTDVTVGITGVGRLDVLSGAALTTTIRMDVGRSAGAFGTVTISDGSQWDTKRVLIGTASTGIVHIKNNAKVTASDYVYIGFLAGGQGSVIVDGPGSSFTNAGTYNDQFWVGRDGGSGSLRVINGATAPFGSLFTSTAPGSASFIEVDGSNSRLEGTRQCNLGIAVSATVQITNGGTFKCGTIADLGFGSVSLSGAGSKWQLGRSLDIGTQSRMSDAALTIGEGSTVEVTNQLRLPNVANNTAALSKGVLNIEGATSPGTFSAAGIVFGLNGLGRINFNHTDASGNYLFATPMSGPGTIETNALGITSLTGNNSYSGNTHINAGVLRAGTATGLSPASDYLVTSGGTLDTNTFSATFKSLDNGGLVTMAAGGTSNVLTVTQNYSGNGGVIAINTALGADSSPTEKLVVQGDTSGNTTLNITNLGGTGAATTGDGIMVVQVDGSSNGTFSLPAPGYVVAGGFRYMLAKVGNNWFLQSDVHVEASGPEASMVCTPAELSDTANQVATCTVTLTAAPTADLPINLVLPAANPRYTTTCTSPIVVAANATQASCTITATPNTTAGDGDVSLELAIAPPTTADAYTPAGPAAQVLIKDAGDTTLPPVTGTPTPVPTLGSLGLAALAALMGAVGLRRSRKTV